MNAAPKGDAGTGPVAEATREILACCRREGADLAGVADTGTLRGLPVVPADLLSSWPFAVAVAVRLEGAIIDEVVDAPTAAYAGHCRSLNTRLNELTAAIEAGIRARGHGAQAVPASQQIDDERLLGAVSHKAVALAAGLGWQGKSLLLVTRRWGPRVRLATVMTDMPLAAGVPARNRCGTCAECARACPASAIRNVSTAHHYARREDAVDLPTCRAKLLRFQERPEIGYTFCGVCISACPVGRTRGAGGEPVAAG